MLFLQQIKAFLFSFCYQTAKQLIQDMRNLQFNTFVVSFLNKMHKIVISLRTTNSKNQLIETKVAPSSTISVANRYYNYFLCFFCVLIQSISHDLCLFFISYRFFNIYRHINQLSVARVVLALTISVANPICIVGC